MNDTVEVYIEHDGETRLVGRCRYVAKRHAQSSVFEYATEWLGHQNAFAIDPENLPLQAGPFYTSSDKSALPGALRDTAPDRWGQLLIKRAFRKAGEDRSIPHGEVLAMTLARQAGLTVADARILDVAGRPVALIKRFKGTGIDNLDF